MGFCFHGYQFEHVNFLSDPRHTRDRIMSMNSDEGMLEGMLCIRSVHILRNGAYLNIQTRILMNNLEIDVISTKRLLNCSCNCSVETLISKRLITTL